jgi:tRNA-splicing ligase RtcB
MELKKIDDNTWEIPKKGGMRVPGRVFASEKLLALMKKDITLQQVANVAHLKGIIRHSIACPDAHQGYGFSIGGVAAFDMDEGIVSPGGVGYDINCGVRLLRTDFTEKEVMGKRKELLDGFFREVPAGVGKGGQTRVTRDILSEVIVKGAEWAVKNGYGTKDDLQRTEEYGRMINADPNAVSDRAMKRGMPQLGTLGAGNHFLEIQKVDRIYDEKVAKSFGVTETGQINVMIHCGSRGLGHQIASDYIRGMEQKFGISGLPDRELVNAPIGSDMGQDYMKAMAGAINFAFVNRQMIAHWTRNVFEKVMGTSEGMGQVYDATTWLSSRSMISMVL